MNSKTLLAALPLALLTGALASAIIFFPDSKDIRPRASDPATFNPSPTLKKVCQQLLEYLQGKRKEFTVKIALEGTAFQKKVWEAIQHIPYGETCSYKDIAIAIGNPKAAIAIGQAARKNPVAIIIPCHRVIGANGDLKGYAGRIEIKEWLLNLEKGNKGK